MSAIVDLLATSVELIFSWVYDRLAKRRPILALAWAVLGLAATLAIITLFYSHYS